MIWLYLLNISILLYLLFDNQKTKQRIMSTQTELTEQVKTLTGKVTKIGTETRTLLEKITALEDALANQANVTPELQAAVNALGAQADVVDGLVPDAPAEEPPVEGGDEQI